MFSERPTRSQIMHELQWPMRSVVNSVSWTIVWNLWRSGDDLVSMFKWCKHCIIIMNILIKFNCRKQATGQITAINVAEASIQLSMANKSQDMILDSQLTMGNHIVTVNKACYFHIRALCHIRKVSARWRSKDSHKQHHPFSSWLLQLAICRDVWDTNFDKLQQVQNTLACIVMTTREVITSLQFRLLFTGCLLSPEWRLRLCHWHTASANQETWHIFVMLIPE